MASPVSNGRRHPEAGFTLMELLVALVLLGMIFLLLASGLQFGTKVWTEREGELSRSSGVLSAHAFLQRILSEARPIMVAPDKTSTRRRAFFAGEENAVLFAAPLPAHLGVGGFHEIALSLVAGDRSGRRIDMSWRPFRAAHLSQPGPERQHYQLMDEVAEFKLAYFGSKQPNQPPRWYSSWTDAQALPELIRIRLRLAGEDRPAPDVVVAPMVKAMNIELVEPGMF